MKQCSWQEVGIVVIVIRLVVVVVSSGGILVHVHRWLGHWHHVVDRRGTAAIMIMMTVMVMVLLALRIGERSVCG